MKKLIGKKIKIIGTHPHTGETGTIDRIESTPVGTGLVIKLEDCPHGTAECFVFSLANVISLGSSLGGRRLK